MTTVAVSQVPELAENVIKLFFIFHYQNEKKNIYFLIIRAIIIIIIMFKFAVVVCGFRHTRARRRLMTIYVVSSDANNIILLHHIHTDSVHPITMHVRALSELLSRARMWVCKSTTTHTIGPSGFAKMRLTNKRIVTAIVLRGKLIFHALDNYFPVYQKH